MEGKIPLTRLVYIVQQNRQSLGLFRCDKGTQFQITFPFFFNYFSFIWKRPYPSAYSLGKTMYLNWKSYNSTNSYKILFWSKPSITWYLACFLVYYQLKQSIRIVWTIVGVDVSCKLNVIFKFYFIFLRAMCETGFLFVFWFCGVFGFVLLLFVWVCFLL